jgi:hypothetical protein
LTARSPNVTAGINGRMRRNLITAADNMATSARRRRTSAQEKLSSTSAKKDFNSIQSLKSIRLFIIFLKVLYYFKIIGFNF